MGQAEYEAFKAKLREWMEAHPEEYAAFEESMNTRDMAGCQAVLLQAIALIPQYRKLAAAKANEGLFDHVDEIERVAQDNDLARKLIGECEQPVAGSPVPAMLCWLYFGKSFERMVEHCEELRRSPDLGLRTREEWKAHREAMRLAESDQVLDWAMEESSSDKNDSKRKPGRPGTTRSLPEMFAPTVSRPEELRRRIGTYLLTRHTQTDIARLKIALDELRYLTLPIPIKPFRDALQEEYGQEIRIVHERGIQEAYSRLTEPLLAGKAVRDRGPEAVAIREIKDFLSETNSFNSSEPAAN